MLKGINKIFLVCFINALFFVQFVDAAAINGARLWRAPDHTRVVLDMDTVVSYKLFSLQNPDRLVVDIENTQNQFSFASINTDNTPIKRVRTAARDGGKLRLVFDLSAAVKPRSFLLEPNKDKPHRLVLDLYDTTVVTKKTINTLADNKQASTAAQNAKRDVLIVVDAGHGGEDPGAIGPGRLYEKVVVLDIARKLANLINNKNGYKAVLTRDGDYFIPLRKRRDKARELRADLFISVHADAFKIPQANGASVFALSRRGATSETARFLAQQENEADLIGGVGDVSLDDKDEVLKGVLVDLSMTATVGASLDVGKKVLNNMGSIARLHKKHVEQAGFLVLKSPDVPSILVETGFISNPTEAKKLATKKYRQQMAEVIFKGLTTYFDRQPPAGSYLAWVKNGGQENQTNVVPSSAKKITHKVVSRDSLSVIAQRYRVSMAKIKKLNNLKSSSVRIGQILVIAEPPRAAVRQSVSHKVKNGETLSEIALLYKTSSAALRKRNNLSSSVIRVGQVLKIN